MPISQPPSDELIAQYLTGTLPQESAGEVRAYLDASPGRRGVMAGVRASLHGEHLATAPSLDDSFARWTVLADQTTRPGATRKRSRLGAGRYPSNRWLGVGLGIGACMLGILGARTIASRQSAATPS